MEAAFVDIGLERNGFLHVDEIVLPDGQKVPRRGHGKGRRIDELIKPKQEVLVQVVKDPLKTKGARLSMQLSIAGRYLVYMPQGGGVGASRRLSEKERERQRKLLQKLHKGDGGVIVRTAAQGALKGDFERDLAYLHKLHEVVDEARRRGQGPRPGLPGGRPLDPRAARRAHQGVRRRRDRRPQAAPAGDQLLPAHRAGAGRPGRALRGLRSPCSSASRSRRRIRSVLSRRVDLPSGGYLMIDYAEALTVIDINTGSFTGRGKGRLEDTITRVNVEAADEVVRQLRLRDIGGIIVIDFIDMARASNRDQVLKTLKKALDEDKTKTYVVEVSPLGLVEMTRQNITDGVREILTKPCPTCEGEGVVESEETVAIDVLRQLRVARRRQARARGVPHPRPPEGRAQAARARQRPARARGGDRQALPLRGWRRASARRPTRSPRRAGATRSSAARSRSASATRCSSRSWSPTCTTSTTPSRGSTPTWSASPGAAATWASAGMVRIDEVGRSVATASLLDAPRTETAPRSAEAGEGGVLP